MSAALLAERTMIRQLHRALIKSERAASPPEMSTNLVHNMFGHCISQSTVQRAMARLVVQEKTKHKGGKRPKAGATGEITVTARHLLRSFVSLMNGRDSTYKLQRGLQLLQTLRTASEEPLSAAAKLEPLRTIFCNASQPDEATTLMIPTLINDRPFAKNVKLNPFFSRHHQQLVTTPFGLEFLLAEVLRHSDAPLEELMGLSHRQLCQRLPRTSTSIDDVARIDVTSKYTGKTTENDTPLESFEYHINITNVSKDVTFRLLSRRWAFHEPVNGTVHEVVGPGVVGKFPLLEPRGSFEYRSGTTLKQGFGYMMGEFQLAVAAGSKDAKLHHAAISATALVAEEK